LWEWFESNFDTIKLKTTDYHDLLNSDQIDAIYCAVPHNLHAQFYTDIIRAGKHLLGEKPFGIDLAANNAILEVINAHPEVFVACSSELPYFPGGQRVMKAIRGGAFGKIIEVEAGLLHSSDIDPNKKINWKRVATINGEYGCMGDLGMHVFHVPLRAGWEVLNVRAMLSKLVSERFNAAGEKVPCDTWDNATLVCEAQAGDHTFPLTLKTHRIAPGESNTWFIRIWGTEASIEYSTRNTKALRTMHYQSGGPQLWSEENLGYDSSYPTISGGIFEFGFSDALLQMWAAFCDELHNGRAGMAQPFYCCTPTETHTHHRVLTAALESHQRRQVVEIG
jgi:predicted dehydrogenase